MGAPARTRSRMRYSSRSPLTMILASGRPASSRMARTCRESAAKSPLSRRTPQSGRPSCAARRAPSKRVVGVDELHGGFAEEPLELAEGFRLAGKRHHPGVRRGAHHRDAVAEAGQRVAGAGAAADVGRARAQHAGFGRVRAARAELDHGAAAGGLHTARRLGGDERLERERREQVGFRNLRLDDGRADGQHRLAGEQRRAFGHGEQVAGEAEVAQVVEEGRRDVRNCGRPRR